MQYLKSFSLPTDNDELGYLFSVQSYKLDMGAYAGNKYPFGIFPHKHLSKIEFAPITIFYGGNGSGKSTLLNIIAEKLAVRRTAPFNDSPIIEDYLQFCSFEMYDGTRRPPRDSSIIASDGVFDYLLDVRAINDGVDRRREDIFREYDGARSELRDNGYRMRSLEDYEQLKYMNEIRRGRKSQFAEKRMNSRELPLKSNGESAFAYFTQKIGENALYLLDEPENSLSAKLQRELASFLEDSVRFYGCQLIISTHSPFLLSMQGAKIYDLDGDPACVKNWSELENIRAYYELFADRRGEFE